MNLYGIKNLQEKYLNYEYDKYYKKVSLILRDIQEKDKIDETRTNLRNNFSNEIELEIDTISLKENFIELLKDDNSAKLLWLLYSKYENEENFIDKISNILKLENRVYRAGVNLYKFNGWMTHSLYTYQVANYNIAFNIPIANFNKDAKVREYVEKLHIIYETLSNTGKFTLKILALIHDIGVIENVTYHDKVGKKYVNQALIEIGITEERLKEFDISYDDLRVILEQIVNYHTVMSLLSGENSDECVENYFKAILSQIPEIKIKKEIAKIIYVFTFADIIAVNEILMDEEKFQRLENAYIFFEETMCNKEHNRNKKQVALERICDMCGKTYSEVLSQIDDILNNFKIDKEEFFKDMYDVKWLHYTGPLMKTINNLEMSIRVFYEVIDYLKQTDGKNVLREYIITFVPNRPTIEYEFLEKFENGEFFRCLEKAKENKSITIKFEKINIEKEENEFGKHLNISIME